MCFRKSTLLGQKVGVFFSRRWHKKNTQTIYIYICGHIYIYRSTLQGSYHIPFPVGTFQDGLPCDPFLWDVSLKELPGSPQRISRKKGMADGMKSVRHPQMKSTPPIRISSQLDETTNLRLDEHKSANHIYIYILSRKTNIEPQQKITPTWSSEHQSEPETFMTWGSSSSH